MTTADEAPENLAGIRVREGWDILRTERPHAAWAIWQSVLQDFPGDAAARAALDKLAAAADLPEVARKPLRFLPPADEAARKRWDKALRIRLASSETPAAAAPADAALAFRSLLDDTPDDAEALWNLAVCQAWMGTNRSAVETLDQFVMLTAERAPDKAADAWTLAELLRHGAGAEDLADAVKLTIRLPNSLRSKASGEDIARAFGPIHDYSLHSDFGPTPFVADMLDRPFEPAGRATAIVIGSIISECIFVLISAPASPAAGIFLRELSDQWRFLNDGERATEVEVSVLPIAMLDAAAFRFRLPADVPDDVRRALTVDALAAWFETDWIEQPRHGLDRMTPAKASGYGSPVMRARLEGIIQFQEQLARRPGRESLYAGYDFDRLRYRLRLGTPPGRDDAKGETRHKALSLYDPDHVRGLKPDTLPPNELAIAWKTAFAVHDDPTAVRLGLYIAEHAPATLAQLSMADFVAPFLRRSLHSGPDSDSGRDWIAFALKTDAELHAGRDSLKILKWKAELASRRGDAQAAFDAWRAACDHHEAAPILTYEAVVDLWEMPGGPHTARRFASESLEKTTNAYVRALLAKTLEPDSEA